MIRFAKIGDEFAIHELICELAEYEKAPNDVINTPNQLRIDLFEDKVCESIVYQKDEQIIGFALYYTSYSTWKGRCLYLEDFYVKPEFRGSGIGSEIFDFVVNIAKEKKVRRMDWQVLDWNQTAIDFYKGKDAILDPEWINGRLFFDDLN